MIGFASSRGLGADLATHLLNALDNDYIELADVRGSMASDLHGAFAEWEVQAEALTKCQRYLYSLSINPDPKQGPLTRDQYMDYIARVEKKLGLEGQGRAVVFHIKEGREHAHVVWSRIDVDQEKAVHLAFDREKLMMVARDFARDYGLELPQGYNRDSQKDKTPQLTLYEAHQQTTTGISKEERQAHITAAWQQSDSPKAFVKALEELGYMLAQGNRPYVLVDIYGHTNSLPKMIDDKSIKIKQVREFLSKDFPNESLPTVEQAKELAAQHRKALEDFHKSIKLDEELDKLKASQATRREALTNEQQRLTKQQGLEKQDLHRQQAAQRKALREAHVKQTKRIKVARAKSEPRGLAAFLGKVTGVNLIRKKLHKHQDKKRIDAYLIQKKQLKERHESQSVAQKHTHDLQTKDMQRQMRALKQVEEREKKSLQTRLEKERRIKQRGSKEHMPAFTLDLKPPGRKAVPHKAMKRHLSQLGKLHGQDWGRDHPQGPPDIREDFERAVHNIEDPDKVKQGGGDERSRHARKLRSQHRRGPNRDKDKDR